MILELLLMKLRVWCVDGNVTPQSRGCNFSSELNIDSVPVGRP